MNLGQSADPLQTLCDQGLALHKAGNLEDAKRLYECVLADSPRHFDALQLLGTACIQTGQLERAVQLIGLAVEIKPDVAIAHGNLGNALNSLNRHEEALASCERAIALDPDYAEAHGNRGAALYRLGRVEEALDGYERVVALKPNARGHCNRGIMLRELGRLNEALDAFDKAAVFEPGHAEAYHGRGVTLRELRRLDEAVASLDRAIKLRPGRAETYYERGMALRELRRPSEALASYDQALAIRPDYLEAWSNRGNALTDLKRDEDALASYDRAITLKPDYAEAFSNRMLPLRGLKRPQEALASSDRALSLRPDYAEGYNNRGSALYEFQRLEEALAAIDKALQLKPDLVEAHINQGVLLHQLRRFHEAHESFDRAVALRPDDPEAHFHQAMCRLATGDYARGWPQYERRWATRQFEFGVRDLGAPFWLGREDLAGRTILLHGEQGLGDTLQFCRYAAPVAARGARVIVEVQAGLERLMARLKGVDQIVVRGAPLPSFDLQTPLLSLPLALGVDPEDHNAPYLSADPAQAARWAQRLRSTRELKVGLCWAGGSRPDQPLADAIDKRRSLPLEAFAPLAGVEGLKLYSLQKGPPAAQLAEMTETWNGPPIIDLADELKDFADTAALVVNLDLIITCDTSTAHLAGGLGRPVWILNRFDTCWRWLDGRTDTPWYPSARLFTQPQAGDWGSVIDAVMRDIRALVGTPR